MTLDPRDVVTEDAFRVHPGLLGRPLAKPHRRALALVVDGILIAILANAPGIVFGLVAALVLLRASYRPPTGGVIRRSARRATRIAAAIVMVPVVVAAWNAVSRIGDDAADSGGAVALGERQVQLEGVVGLATGADFIAFVSAEDEAEATDHARRIVARLREAGTPTVDILEMIGSVEELGLERPWLTRAMQTVLAEVRAEAVLEQRQEVALEASAEVLAARYSSAVAAGDSSTALAARAELATLLAREPLQELETDLRLERERSAYLEQALDTEREEFGIIDAFNRTREDFGLGFGWTSLYFTAFIVLWRGRTPGKRLLGLRVIRLDDRPIGWWNAFERFAGYAAGLATGLLGFIQIFWDRNRQAVQDKIAMTVVVQD